MERIAQRDRIFERNMERGYIAQLRTAYDSFFASYTETPVLVIDTNDLDLVRDDAARAQTPQHDTRCTGRLPPGGPATSYVGYEPQRHRPDTVLFVKPQFSGSAA